VDRSYNIYRWYRSGWGRYTQSDPLGLWTDINSFRYANDSAIVNIDPLGLLIMIKGPPDPTQTTWMCDGHGGMKVQIGTPFTRDEIGCFGDCLVQHEGYHEYQAYNASRGNVCKGKPYGMWGAYQSAADAAAWETPASKATIECLNAIIGAASQAKDCKCRTLASSYRKRVQQYINCFNNGGWQCLQ